MGPVILTIGISLWMNIVKGSCPGSYYHCTGYSWCCPSGYSCTGTSICDKSKISGGAIAGGVIGGIVLVVVICCVAVNIKSKSGKVSRVIYPKRRAVGQRTDAKKQQPSSSRPNTRQNENYNISRMTLPGSYEPTNHHITHHI